MRKHLVRWLHNEKKQFCSKCHLQFQQILLSAELLNLGINRIAFNVMWIWPGFNGNSKWSLWDYWIHSGRFTISQEYHWQIYFIFIFISKCTGQQGVYFLLLACHDKVCPYEGLVCWCLPIRWSFWLCRWLQRVWLSRHTFVCEVKHKALQR